MKPWILAPAGLAALGAVALTSDYTTDYTGDRALRVETRSAMELETTSMDVTIDGEPVDRGFGGGSSSSTHRVVTKDVVLAHEGGEPTKVRRTFETLDGSGSMTFGDSERSDELDSDFEGVTLELVREDGAVVAEVVDGDEPSGDGALEGHALTLLVDAFLPKGEVAVDDTWSVEKDAIVRGLGVGLESKLFQRPERAEGEEGGRGGRGRRGGGGMGSRGGIESFSELDWDGEAKLVSTSEEHEGVTCAVIELKLEGSGELPMPEWGGRGGRREQSAAPSAELGARARGTEMSVELEGRLLFALDSRRPVALELEGPVRIETLVESTRGEREMVMETTQEGTLTYVVTVTETTKDEE